MRALLGIHRARESEPSDSSGSSYAVKIMLNQVAQYVVWESDLSGLVQRRPHPCLVLVYDVRLLELDRGQMLLFLVMEFCHGLKLSTSHETFYDCRQS